MRDEPQSTLTLEVERQTCKLNGSRVGVVSVKGPDKSATNGPQAHG
jgi:hypothetical protein